MDTLGYRITHYRRIVGLLEEFNERNAMGTVNIRLGEVTTILRKLEADVEASAQPPKPE